MRYLVLKTVIIALVFSGCSSVKSIKTNEKLATNSPIVTNIDISKVTNDKVPVIINPGKFNTDKVLYRLPKVIQGTYAVSDFGRFIDNFKALNYEGQSMPAKKIDENTWEIANATQLDVLSYQVNDTYDIETPPEPGSLFSKDVPFSPAGTNIEADNFVLNLHGFIGYFEQLKNSQYQLSVTAPSDFKRSSALQQVGETKSKDGTTITTQYFAPRYFDITDNPMMYGKLDIEEFMVGNIKIVLSVYSPNKKHTALSLKETVFKMMEAQKAYLGDLNSTARYDIFLYLSRGDKTSPMGYGALEHQTSTVVVFLENAPKQRLDKSMVDIVSHEFFHILTPLSVHSEDVHYFDYNNPTFSKHLWMYEGVTEYFAQHFQVYQGLVSPQEFIQTIQKKIGTSRNFKDTMSFTKMSEHILEKPYASNYYNVYLKGALIGMCIDILIREESNGNRGLLSFMKELSLKYGKNKPFVDDDFISEITKMTYPSVGQFLKKHVVGNTPINYDLFFKKAGLINKNTKIEGHYLQASEGFVVSVNHDQGNIYFSERVKDNSFWIEQGVMPSDIIKEVNGKVITINNIQEFIKQLYGWKPGQDIEVKLDRNGKEVTINTKTTTPYVIKRSLVIDDNATENQISLRKAWLNQ